MSLATLTREAKPLLSRTHRDLRATTEEPRGRLAAWIDERALVSCASMAGGAGELQEASEP